jgi:glucose-6-phosphate dehydrogenase assembly protein OpcA
MEELGRARVEGVGGVERGLAELRHGASAGGVTVVRACALNLVVVCREGADEGPEATAVAARIAEAAPARTLVVVPTAAAASDLQVSVSAHCHRDAEGVQVCSEQVTLETPAGAQELVSGTVLQLLVGDVPVYTWWRRSRLAEDSLLAPLCDFSDYLIVDGAAFERPGRFLRELRGLRKCRIADVTWARTEPWREAVASFFDDPALRGRLDSIARVEVRASGPAAEDGLTAAGAYLIGWLASRLGWRPGAAAGTWQRRDGGKVEVASRRDAELPAGDIAAVRIELGGAGTKERVVLVAERTEGAERDFARLTVAGTDPETAPRTMKLPSRDVAALLCGILQHTGPDLTYGAALAAAVRPA